MEEVFGYRKLIAYQKGKEVVKQTDKLLKNFPADERYAMCDQLRRASESGRAPWRVASLRGERSNVPREARLFTERRMCDDGRIKRGNGLKIEILGNFGLKILGVFGEICELCT